MFSKPETIFFFQLIDELTESSGQILLNDAHEMGREHGLKIVEAAAALSKMERLRWLKVVKRGLNQDAMLVFGARAIVELPRVRNLVRQGNIHTNGTATEDGSSHLISQSQSRYDGSQRGSQRLSQPADVENDSEEEVINRSSRRQSSMPRMSQEHELMDIEDDNRTVRDDDEDEIQPSQLQSRKRTRTRSTRSSRRSSRRDYD